MARDIYAVPATSAGVEREFSISGRIITKQHNRLSPSTIRDLMQYKHWVVKHGITFPSVDDETEIEEEETDIELEEDLGYDASELENEMSLSEWIRNWEKKEKEKEKISQRLTRLARPRWLVVV